MISGHIGLQSHKARNNNGPIYGWCSWYDRTTKIDEAHVLDVVDTIEKIPTPLERELYRLMMDIKLWMVHGMQMLSFHPGCLG